MTAQPEWQWNEFQQVGTDYADVTEVERYESRMGQFRDLAGEDRAILQTLDLREGARVLEIGTGTGHFAIAAARLGCRVTAVDVSPVMLEYAAERARSQGLAIAFAHAGFLTFPYSPGTFDAVVSAAALHHLPDVWKAVALRRVYHALRPGGRFLLRDVVFSWQGDDHAAAFEDFINACPPAVRPGAVGHAAREYSTLGWIMTGLLERAGFEITRTTPDRASLVEYLCLRPVG